MGIGNRTIYILLATVLLNIQEVVAKDKRGDGPNCVSCTGVREPSQCQETIQCWASQQCYTEKYMHPDGHLLYDFGCKQKEECALIERNSGRQRRLDISLDVCEECCHGELCNANICLNQTEPLDCHTCEDEANLHDCGTVHRCDADEVCYAEKVITNSPHPVFTLGCLPQLICKLLETGTQTLVGRSLGKSRNKRVTHLCQKCCSSPKCNIDLCESEEVTTAHYSHTPRLTSAESTNVTVDGKIPTSPFTRTTSTESPATTTTLMPDSVRLVGGNNSYEGRVEIFHDGEWGTICQVNDAAAGVVCVMLGYPRAEAAVRPNGFYGSGTGIIWVGSVYCSGDEIALSDCINHGWATNTCPHSEDIGVECSLTGSPKARLVNNHSPNSGAVEIFHNDRWGTLCDHNFGNKEASVLCHMLGYPREAAIGLSTRVLRPSGSQTFGQVTCNGTEDNIIDCGLRDSHWPCGLHDQAAASCQPRIRLVNGTSIYEGTVEIYKDNRWGTICDDNFNNDAAAVVCNMLGNPRTGAKVLRSGNLGSGRGPTLLANVTCSGQEDDIDECTHGSWGKTSCPKPEDVGVSCAPPVRLVNGSSAYNGTIEVYHDGKWGTMCGHYVPQGTASVVCHMLGYERTGAQAFSVYRRTEARGDQLLDRVSCSGEEDSLEGCRVLKWFNTDCRYQENAAASCHTQFRLVNGSGPHEGILEVYRDRQWGRICTDFFDDRAAGVFCSLLLYPRAGAKTWAHLPKGYYSDKMTCTGEEKSFEECKHSVNYNCPSHRDAGLTCDITRCLDGGVLHDGSCYFFDVPEGCGSLKASLVTVDSIEEKDFLVDYLRNGTGDHAAYWLTDGRLVNSTWVWSDSGRPVDMSVVKWGPHHPGRWYCLAFSRTAGFLMADVYCGREINKNICEKPLK